MITAHCSLLTAHRSQRPIRNSKLSPHPGLHGNFLRQPRPLRLVIWAENSCCSIKMLPLSRTLCTVSASNPRPRSSRILRNTELHEFTSDHAGNHRNRFVRYSFQGGIKKERGRFHQWIPLKKNSPPFHQGAIKGEGTVSLVGPLKKILTTVSPRFEIPR